MLCRTRDRNTKTSVPKKQTIHFPGGLAGFFFFFLTDYSQSQVDHLKHSVKTTSVFNEN